MSVRAVAVDFGGTLGRPGPSPDGAAVATVLASLEDTWFPQEFAAVFDTVHRQVRETDRARATHTSFADEIRQTAESCGAVVPDPHAAAEAVFTAVPDAQVDAEAARALWRLHAGGLICVLACDTQRPEAVRRHTLAAAGIEGCFDALVLSSNLGVRKPHPAFYRAVVEATGCPPHEVLFIGDTLAKDVLGPLGHGMRTALIAPRGRPPGLAEEIPVLEHFARLPAYLEAADAD